MHYLLVLWCARDVCKRCFKHNETQHHQSQHYLLLMYIVYCRIHFSSCSRVFLHAFAVLHFTYTELHANIFHHILWCKWMKRLSIYESQFFFPRYTCDRNVIRYIAYFMNAIYSIGIDIGNVLAMTQLNFWVQHIFISK